MNMFMQYSAPIDNIKKMPVETAWCYIVLNFSEGSICGSCNTDSCMIVVSSFK